MLVALPPRDIKTTRVETEDLGEVCKLLFGEYSKYGSIEYCSVPIVGRKKAAIIRKDNDTGLTEVHYTVRSDVGEDVGVAYTTDRKYQCVVTRKEYSYGVLPPTKQPLEEYVIDCKIGDVTINEQYFSYNSCLSVGINGKRALEIKNQKLQEVVDLIHRRLFTKGREHGKNTEQEDEGFEVVE